MLGLGAELQGHAQSIRDTTTGKVHFHVRAIPHALVHAIVLVRMIARWGVPVAEMARYYIDVFKGKDKGTMNAAALGKGIDKSQDKGRDNGKGKGTDNGKGKGKDNGKGKGKDNLQGKETRKGKNKGTSKDMGKNIM